MAGFSNTVEDAVLNLVLRGTAYSIAQASHLSLHTADPGDTGANEATGGSYARQAATWGAASSGVCTLSGAVAFPGMPASTIGFYGIWTASTSGVFIGSGPCTTRVLNATDTYTLTTATTFSLD